MTSGTPRSPRVRYGADYADRNPYQTLLYRAVGPTVDARPAGLAEVCAEAAEDPRGLIYHLHWEEDRLRAGEEAGRRAAAQALLDGLEALRAAGVPVVWTRHNRRPHDPALRAAQARLAPHLAAVASVTHVHSWAALEEIAEHEPVDPERVVVIGHGNFVGRYAEWPEAAARARLGLPEAAFVLLLFGRIAPYKQAPAAVEAFRAAAAAVPEVEARLLIVGEGRDPELATPPADPRVVVVEGFVPDAEVGLHHAAADAVLLPYRDALTSGAAMLAASLGRGVIGPDVAGLRDLVQPGRTGALYDKGALETALATALREGRGTWRARGARALAQAVARDWAVIGRQWRDLFHRLAAEPVRGRATPRVAPA